MLVGSLGYATRMSPRTAAVRPLKLCDDADVRRSLLLEEYKAIRAKSAEARDNQQSIIQWSLAAVGVVTAGILAGSRSSGDGDTFRLAVAFGLCTVVPIILLAALAIWLSEVSRMLRAARYLRGREKAFGAESSPARETSHKFAELPIIWEGLLATEDTWRGKADLGFIAVVLMYGVLVVLSCGTGLWTLYAGGNPENFYEGLDWSGVGVSAAISVVLASYVKDLRRSRTT